MPRSPNSVDLHVGGRMAARRLALGLSQTALAQRMGISAQQVQKYEAGTNRISASRLHEIARMLGQPPGSFFPDSPEEPTAGRASETVAVGLRLMTATPEGRAIADSFPLIPDRRLRQALAQIAGALVPK